MFKKFLSAFSLITIFFIPQAFAIKVTAATNLDPFEKEYCAKRVKLNEKHNADFIMNNLHKNPTNLIFPKIGLVLSGGGYRATLGGLACLDFFEDFLIPGTEGATLLNLTSYITGLSGSTWALSAVLARNYFSPEMTIEQIQAITQERLDSIKFESFIDDAIFEAIYKRFFKKKSFNPVDIWGSLFSLHLIGDLQKSQDLSFNEIRTFLKNSTKYPYPILTAAISTGSTTPSEFLEISPSSVGSTYLTGRIPTEYFGCEFSDGESVAKPEELTLPTIMGFCGAAYSFNFKEAFNVVAESIQTYFGKLFEHIYKTKAFYDERFIPSYFNNFTYGMENSPLADEKNLILTDGGVINNLPLLPMLQRNIDIIFIGDFSSNAPDPGLGEYGKAVKQLTSQGYQMPSLDKYQKAGNHVFIFEGDTKTPTIIYLENYINFSTLKFNYTKEESAKLASSIKEMLISAQNAIIGAIERKILYLNDFAIDYQPASTGEEGAYTGTQNTHKKHCRWCVIV